MVGYFEHAHALIIGVGADLPNTEIDAKGLVTVLTAQDRCAYPKDRVQPLLGPQATRENILTALRELSQKSRPDFSNYLLLRSCLSSINSKR